MIAQILPLPKGSSGTFPNPKVAVRHHLTATTHPWFLIVDSADDHKLLFDTGAAVGRRGFFWDLPENDQGVILFTTRSRKMAVDAAGSRVIDVEQVNKEEAAMMFERLIIHKDLLQDRDLLQELLDELTRLPLAIAQAAAYTNKLEPTLSEYLKLLRASTGSLASLMSEDFVDNAPGPHSKQHISIATTWLVSFEQIL